MAAVLKIEGISKSFGGLKALSDVSFSVSESSITALIGPNGAGKTTLFNIISGFMQPDSGTIHYLGNDISGEAAHIIATKGIIRTFQALSLSDHMTVEENVMLGRHSKSYSGFLKSILKLPSSRKEERSIREESREILSRFSLLEQAEKPAAALPLGIRRMVELARALAAEPQLLLLDEPASGLTIRETEELARTISVIGKNGVSILLVEHDMTMVMELSEMVVVLNFGEKIAEARPEEIQSDPRVIQSYLGEEDA